MKFKVLKESDDYACRMRVGDIIDMSYYSNLEELPDIFNVSGGHFKKEELFEYFEVKFEDYRNE